MCAETSTRSASYAVFRRDSSGAALGLVLDMPVVVVPLGPVQKTIEILQLQFIDKVFDVCCAGPAISGAVCEETVELPQLQPVLTRIIRNDLLTIIKHVPCFRFFSFHFPLFLPAQKKSKKSKNEKRIKKNQKRRKSKKKRPSSWYLSAKTAQQLRPRKVKKRKKTKPWT